MAGVGVVAQGLQNGDDLVDAGEVPGVPAQAGGDGFQRPVLLRAAPVHELLLEGGVLFGAVGERAGDAIVVHHPGHQLKENKLIGHRVPP